MGWIESRNDKHRGVYRDTAGLRHRSPWMPYRPQAQAWLDRHEPTGRLGVGRDPKAGLISLRDWEKVWWPTRVVERRSLTSDRGRMDRILDEFGDYPLAAISPIQVQAWANRMHKRRSAGTVRKYVRLLSVCLSAAVMDQRIAENPCRLVRLPAVNPGREVFLTREQVDALDTALGDRWGTVAYTLAYTGLRWGELAGLHVGSIDFLRGVVHVVEVLEEDVGGFSLKPYPKGGDRRTVPLPKHLVDRLAAHLVAFPAQPCGLHRRCTGLVFTSTHDTPMSRHSWLRYQFRPAVEKAKLPGELRPHDLRHTFASWLVQDGVPLREVQAILGHKSITTSERYAHLAPNTGERTRQALERVRRPGPGSSRRRPPASARG